MIQLMKAYDTAVRQNGTMMSPLTDTRGAAIPDGSCTFYASEQASVAPNAVSTPWHSGDPPGSGVNSAEKSVSIDDSFTDYVIYKSNHHDSIWVTVASDNWKFQAAAVNRSKRHADVYLEPGYAVNGTIAKIPDYTEPLWIWPSDLVGVNHPSADMSIDCAK